MNDYLSLISNAFRSRYETQSRQRYMLFDFYLKELAQTITTDAALSAFVELSAPQLIKLLLVFSASGDVMAKSLFEFICNICNRIVGDKFSIAFLIGVELLGNECLQALQNHDLNHACSPILSSCFSCNRAEEPDTANSTSASSDLLVSLSILVNLHQNIIKAANNGNVGFDAHTRESISLKDATASTASFLHLIAKCESTELYSTEGYYRLRNHLDFLHSMEATCSELDAVRSLQNARCFARHSARWLSLSSEKLRPHDTSLVAALRKNCATINAQVSSDSNMYLPFSRCSCGTPRQITGISDSRAYLSRDRTSMVLQFSSVSPCHVCSDIRPAFEVIISESIGVPPCVEDLALAPNRIRCVCGSEDIRHFKASFNCVEIPSLRASERKENADVDGESTGGYDIHSYVPALQITNKTISILCKCENSIGIEACVASLVSQYASIFKYESGEFRSNLQHAVNSKMLFITHLNEYAIVQVSATSGVIEFIEGARSFHDIKRETCIGDGAASAFGCSCNANECCPGTCPKLCDYFQATHTTPCALNFAILSFIRSIAPWCVVTYLLNIKDRHNGNVLLLPNGQMLHVDFSFSLLRAPGGPLSLEQNRPCYITREMIDLMDRVLILDGDGEGDQVRVRVEGLEYFRWLLWRCFISARRNREEMESWLHLSLLNISEISGSESETLIPLILSQFGERHFPRTDEAAITKEYVWKALVDASLNSSACCGRTCDLYGCYQSIANNIYR